MHSMRPMRFGNGFEFDVKAGAAFFTCAATPNSFLLCKLCNSNFVQNMKFETMADLRFTGPQFLNAELENVLVYLPMDT